MEIKINNIMKNYNDVRALKGLSIEASKDSIIGVIGHNGSGKTTLLEILSGLIIPDSGSIEPEINQAYREKLGVVLQANAFYDDAKVIELLKLFATFFAQSVDIDELINKLGIEKYTKRYYKDLSGGMKQKVNIALALVNNPELLILDEPTTGLDPLARNEVWHILQDFMKDKTIFISSHSMEEVAKFCDTILFLKEGEIVYYGSVERLLNEVNMSLDEYYVKINGGETHE